MRNPSVNIRILLESYSIYLEKNFAFKREQRAGSREQGDLLILFHENLDTICSRTAQELLPLLPLKFKL
jgi:hypothetical protein